MLERSTRPARTVLANSTSMSPDESEQNIRLIQNSGSFDLSHYVQQNGKDFSLRHAIEHYLDVGAKEGLNPNAQFNSAFYLECNPDVAEGSINPLVHFLAFGAAEARYTNAGSLAADVQLLNSSGYFDELYYGKAYKLEGQSRLELMRHYLTIGWRNNHRPNRDFDGSAYKSWYPDAKNFRKAPIFHLMTCERPWERKTCHEQIEADLKLIRDSELFDEAYYRKAHGLTKEDVGDAAAHYLLIGEHDWLAPSERFSPEWYYNTYQDIDRKRISALAHYLQAGQHEGRLARCEYQSMFVPGKAAHDPAKPNLLIALHECSRTGAPLLGLGLALKLGKEYNLIIWAGKTGELQPRLEALAFLLAFEFCEPVKGEFIIRDLCSHFPVHAAIVNSVEARIAAQALHGANVPIVALIHEYSEYSMPQGKIESLSLTADRTIFPSEDVRRSAMDEIFRRRGCRVNLGIVQPQGLLPDGVIRAHKDDLIPEKLAEKLRGKKVVLGAGHVHQRKGVDLFIDTARHLSRIASPDTFHFLWIGGGYDPEQDAQYSAWLSAAIDRMELGDTVSIIKAQPSLDWAFEAADVFFLSSRLDPFPNVVIDALAADVPVICFDKATGCAEFMKHHDARGRVVPYLDSVAAADAIFGLLNESLAGKAPDTGNQTSNIVAKHLNFDTYVLAVQKELQVAQDICAKQTAGIEALISSKLFDAEFFDSTRAHHATPLSAAREYLTMSMKNVTDKNSRPGFNDLSYRSTHMQPSVDEKPPLLHAIEHGKGSIPKTHECMIISPLDGRTSSQRGARLLRIALHVHLYYSDLCLEFLEKLNSSGIQCDVFISCKDEDAQDEISVYMDTYTGGDVIVRAVPNRGRDMGPMLSEFGAAISTGNYDLVGHLHGKKTLSQGPGFPADGWRKYLWEHLLGNKFAWQAIQKSFEEDEKLGLVFPEDRHSIGWTENLDAARALHDRLELTPALPASPIFPLGMMFWARPQAIKPLFDAGLDWEDYPEEPLDEDGTILHAMERLLPSVCEATKHHWKTIYIRGMSW